MNLSMLSALLANWSIDPLVVIGLVITGALYWAGYRYAQRTGIERRHLTPWRIALFILALLVIFFTLDSPLDTLADSLVYMHMIQHELLTMVAAPLLLLSQPFMLIWRGVPLVARRATLGWMARTRWPLHALEAIVRFWRKPVVSWLAFTLLFSAWHLPGLYDAATENNAIHAIEHLCFLATAVFFWSQFIPSLPWKPRLSYPAQALYFAAAAMWGNVMGFAFMFTTTPIYPYYAALPRAAGAISAVTDVHLAGGVMDAADTALFISAIIIALALWLRDDERRQAALDTQIAASLAATSSPSTPL